MKEKISSNAFVYISALVSFIIIFLIFLSGIHFSVYRTTDSLPLVWYLITETGDWYSAIAISLLLFLYLHIYFKKFSKRVADWYIFIVIVILMHVSTIIVTQSSVKNVVHEPRPYQKLLLDSGIISNDFDTVKSTKEYLSQKIRNSGSKTVTDVYPPIINSWICNSGFSFPSGHAQNSFFLATIIAFVIYKTVDRKRKYYMVIPFIWAILVCISRVVMGFHYPWDVEVGAFIGMIIAFLLISLKEVNEIFDSYDLLDK